MKVTYEQTYCRSVEVEVTEEELRLLKGESGEARDAVIRRVVGDALDTIEAQPCEFVMACCTDEESRELFDVG